MGAGSDNAPALRFSCTCGTLTGQLSPEAAASGTRLVCHCPDCRAAELFLGQPDPAPDGVDLFQTTPDMIRIETGADRLGLLRLSPNGLMRWHATCCGAPIANTLKTPRVPFAGIAVARLDDPEALGPVRVTSFIPRPGRKPGFKGLGRMMVGFVSRTVAARLSGRWRQTPFFDPDTGTPVAEAQMPTRAERAALY